MSSESVFCPRCGSQSVPGDRFCKRCGTNLETISRVLTGNLAPAQSSETLSAEMEIEYAREFSKAMYNLIGSLLTFFVLMFVFRGQWWVFFLLFWVADSVRDLVQASILKRQIQNPAAFHAALEAFKDKKKEKRRRKRRERDSDDEPKALPAPAHVENLVSSQPHHAYVEPKAPTTGKLSKPEGLVFDPENPPPSVTEGTTRLLDDRAEDGEETPRYMPPNRSVSH